jgi:hypothetical protein
MILPALNLLERWALHLLIRSPRTALVVVKCIGDPEMAVASNPLDPVAFYVTSGGSKEPLSMQLERIYHQPAFGEEE